MKEKNQEGFTLIEIIVSISIGVVVLGIVLSLILTSFDTFGTFSTKKLKKEALDSIVEFVRDQTQNATDVVISKTPPKLGTSGKGDWKWLAVANGRLYDGSYTYSDKNKSGSGSGRMYTTDSFYNAKDSYDRDGSQTTLSLTYSKSTSDDTSDAKATKKVRIVTFHYTLSNHSEIYKKDDAIEFSNVAEVTSDTSLNTGDLRSLNDVQSKDAVSLDNHTTMNMRSFTDQDTNILRIYYQATKTTSQGSDDDDQNENTKLTHTVADKIYAMTANSNRGYYVGTCNNFQDKNDVNFYGHPEKENSYNIPLANTYRAGDFVYDHGHWWLLMQNGGSPEYNQPQNDAGSGIWQCLDENFYKGNTYNYGDIVKFDNIYYEYLKKSDVEWNDPTLSETTDEVNTNGKTWLNLGKEMPTRNGYDSLFTNLANGDGATALAQTTPASSPALDSSRTSLKGIYTYSTNYNAANIPVYDPATYQTGNYKVGSLIQVKVKGSGDTSGNHAYYRLYKKIFEPASYIDQKDTVPGNSFQSGWELLESEYMPSSAYETGATVRIGSGNDYIRVKAPGDESLTFTYQDTSSQTSKEETLTLSSNTICSSEAELYYGLKYEYIDPKSIQGHYVTYTYDNKQVSQFVLDQATFQNEDHTDDQNTDRRLTKAMIYLPKESSQGEVSNAKNNPTVRNLIFERVSYDQLKG